MARDINLLHPSLRPKAEELIKRAKAAGIDIIITQTLRTKAEQDELYAQGRTKPGNIVTQAKYPQSLHCWGVAFDIAVVIGGKANWDTTWYKKVGPLGEALGLEWGGRWTNFPDYPHYQLPGYSWTALVKQYGSPENFIKTWREVKPVAAVDVKVFVKGKEIPGKLVDGKTWVPLRDLIETLAPEIIWDEKTRTVIVK